VVADMFSPPPKTVCPEISPDKADSAFALPPAIDGGLDHFRGRPMPMKGKRLAARREDATGDEEPQARRQRAQTTEVPPVSQTIAATVAVAEGAVDEALAGDLGSVAAPSAPSRRKCSGGTPAGGNPQQESSRYKAEFARVMAHSAIKERQEVRARLQRDAQRLGCFKRIIGGKRDDPVQWEKGAEAEELEVLRTRIVEQKQMVERLRKSLARPKPQRGSECQDERTPEELEDDIWEQRELCNSKQLAIQRDDTELRDRDQRLHVERVEYLRRCRDIEAEDSASLSSFPLLRQRYQILRLLRRHGATEIYRAHDLNELQPVTVKIHSLATQLKASDLECLTRECETLQRLRHQGLASFYDFFLLEGGGSFSTIWEFCDGESLEAFLLRHAPLPEKEARGLVLQLLMTLRFLESRGLRVIDRDLKSSRLAIRGGELKITSVCLSYLSDSSGVPRRDLIGVNTSPGASMPISGAPDSVEDEERHSVCVFQGIDARPVGVLLFEMLFGNPPCAIDIGQDLQASVGASADGFGVTHFPQACGVQIPEAPKISAECREFLRILLDQDHRPTVQDACADAFIAPTRRCR